jgi:hypothetical protein
VLSVHAGGYVGQAGAVPEMLNEKVLVVPLVNLSEQLIVRVRKVPQL